MLTVLAPSRYATPNYRKAGDKLLAAKLYSQPALVVVSHSE
jgi:hypothetical protein